jgi:hypothetical protein
MEVNKAMNRYISATKTIFLLAAILALAGCSLLTGETSTPTVDSQVFASTVAAVQTEAIQSVYTQLTQSAALTPSATLPPSPTDTPQATDTLLPVIEPSNTPIPATATKAIPATQFPTATPTQSAYQCSITALKPTNGTSVTKGSDFDLNVTLKNIGSETWDRNDIDFRYLSGAEFQKRGDVLDLPVSVDPDDSINLIVDMVADTDTGTQTATWGLVRSGSTFCSVGIRVIVK